MGVTRTSWVARWALGLLMVGYALIAVAASVPGSPLTPPLPPGTKPAAALARTASALGLDRPGRFGLTVVALCLLAGLVGAFVVLLVEAWRGRVGLRAVAVAGAVAIAFAVVAPVLVSRDVYSYAAYGRIVSLHGSNPYVQNPTAYPGDPFTRVLAPAWRHTRSVYGPAFTLLSAALSGGSPAADLLAFKVVAALAVGGAGWLGALALREWGLPERAPFGAALVLLNPVIVVHTVGGAHNDALVALCVAGAAWLASRWRPVEAPPGASRRDTPSALGGRGELVVLVLAAAALVKIVAVIPLFVFAWVAGRKAVSRRQAVRTLADVAVVAGGLTLFMALPFGLHGLTGVANLASRQGGASGARLVARGAQALGRAVAGSGGGRVFGAVVYVLFLDAFAVLLWWILRRAEPRSLPRDWGVALVAFALAAPYLLPWYAAWFLPLLAFSAVDTPALVGIGAACLLALAEVPAEQGSSPLLWRDMELAVHYVAAPAMLSLFVVLARHLARPAP